jgi:hypothetical protein
VNAVATRGLTGPEIETYLQLTARIIGNLEQS